MDQTAYFEQMRTKRRNEILAAARKMILKQGMADFTIQKLARTLDISTVTLYKYFKNMDDIMSALKEECLTNALGKFLLLVPVKREGNGLETFAAVTQLFFEHALKCKDDLTLLVLFEAHTLGLSEKEAEEGAISAYAEKMNEAARELLEQAKADESASPDLDIPEAMDFMMQMNGAMLQHIGLIPASVYKKEKPKIQAQIKQMIKLYELYLSSTL